jgi:hypothetical protein
MFVEAQPWLSCLQSRSRSNFGADADWKLKSDRIIELKMSLETPPVRGWSVGGEDFNSPPAARSRHSESSELRRFVEISGARDHAQRPGMLRAFLFPGCEFLLKARQLRRRACAWRQQVDQLEGVTAQVISLVPCVRIANEDEIPAARRTDNPFSTARFGKPSREGGLVLAAIGSYSGESDLTPGFLAATLVKPGDQVMPLRLWGRLHPRHTEHGRKQIDQLHQTVDLPSGMPASTWPADDERHVQQALVGRFRLGKESLFSREVSMIGRDNDPGVVEHATIVEVGQQSAHLVVNVANISVVICIGEHDLPVGHQLDDRINIQAVKGVNQLKSGLSQAARLEAIALAVLSGVEPSVIHAAFKAGSVEDSDFLRTIESIDHGRQAQRGVKFRELPYFLAQAEKLGFELPLTKALYGFMEKGEPLVLDDHRQTPSFWNELMKRPKSAAKK